MGKTTQTDTFKQLRAVMKDVNGDNRLWTTLYPGGAARDYDYPCDIVRMY